MHYVVCVRLLHAQNECVAVDSDNYPEHTLQPLLSFMTIKVAAEAHMNPHIVSVWSLKSEVKNRNHVTQISLNLTDLDLLNDRNYKTTKDNPI